ncbi:DUF1080 domain-containing protein [soil metagenome]
MYIKYIVKITIVVLITTGLMAACDSAESQSDESEVTQNSLSQQEIDQGWILLFDGETIDGWRGYNRADFPDGWEVEDGTLYCTCTGGDILYDQKFLNFHLKIDWKISEGGNSGVFILGQEIEDRPIWHTAPEVQILDNEAHPDVNADQFAPALYDLIPPSVQNTRSAGEWNTIEVLLNEGELTVRQNGADAVRTQIGNAEWEEMVDESKFPVEIFGQLEPGYIAVQDHGDEVWFRNIKILELD